MADAGYDVAIGDTSDSLPEAASELAASEAAPTTSSGRSRTPRAQRPPRPAAPAVRSGVATSGGGGDDGSTYRDPEETSVSVFSSPMRDDGREHQPTANGSSFPALDIAPIPIEDTDDTGALLRGIDDELGGAAAGHWVVNRSEGDPTSQVIVDNRTAINVNIQAGASTHDSNREQLELENSALRAQAVDAAAAAAQLAQQVSAQQQEAAAFRDHVAGQHSAVVDSVRSATVAEAETLHSAIVDRIRSETVAEAESRHAAAMSSSGAEAEARIQAIRDELSRAVATAESARHEAEQTLLRERSDFESLSARRSYEINEYKREVATSKQELGKAHLRIDELQVSVARAEGRASELESSVVQRCKAEHQRACEYYREAYKRELQDKLGKLDGQQAQTLSGIIKKLRGEVEDLTERVQEGEELMAKKTARCEELERENVILTREARKARSDTSSGGAGEIADLKAKITDLRARIRSLEHDVAERDKVIGGAHTETANLSLKIGDLRRQLDHANDKLAKAEKDMRELGDQRKVELREHTAQIRALTEERGRLAQRPPIPSRMTASSGSPASGASIERQYNADWYSVAPGGGRTQVAPSANSGSNHSPTPHDSVSQVSQPAARRPSDSLSISASTVQASARSAAAPSAAPSAPRSSTSQQAAQQQPAAAAGEQRRSSRRSGGDRDDSSDGGSSRRRRRSRRSRRRRSSSGSSSGSDTRHKEGDSVNVPKLPTQACELRAWKQQTFHSIKACAKNGSKAWKWIKEVEEEGSKISDFAKSGRGLSKLDNKLCYALHRLLGSSSSLAQQVHQRDQEWQNEHSEPLNGRQIMWIICDYLSVSSQRRKVYGLKDLESVAYRGDTLGDMETFLCRWTDVLTSMEERPSELQLRDIFLDQVRKSRSELTPFVRDYENADEGNYF